MKVSEELFSLIKSLSKSEKRYVKQYASMHGHKESNYLKLFDAVDQQKHPDETGIKRKFHGETFIRQLSVTKNYLHRLILKSMEAYHSRNSVDMHIRSLLNRADFLFIKGQYAGHEKMLDRAKALSEKYELHYFSMEILNAKRRIAHKELDDKKLSSIRKEKTHLLSLLHHTEQWQDLSDAIVSKFHLYGRTKEQVKILHWDRKNILLLKKKDAPKTFLAKRNYLNCNLFYYSAISDEKEDYRYAKKSVDLYLSHPSQMEYDISHYLISLNNVLCSCLMLRKMDEMNYFINKITEAEKYITTAYDVTLLLYLQYHYLNYYNSLGQFKTSAHHCRRIIGQISIYENNLNSTMRLVLMMNIAYTYFGCEDYHAALHWLNQIRNEPIVNINPDQLCFHRIFYLIIHFELKNFDMVPSLVRATYRFLREKKRLNPFEKIFLSFFKKILRAHSYSEKQQVRIFNSLKETIERMKVNIKNTEVLSYFDYPAWLESKITGKPFAEIIREKAESSSIHV